MLQQAAPDDFVIATGQTHSLEQFVEHVFSALRLDWREFVESDVTMLRPTDILVSKANPTKAKQQLGWAARLTMPEVAERMVQAYQKDEGQ